MSSLSVFMWSLLSASPSTRFHQSQLFLRPSAANPRFSAPHLRLHLRHPPPPPPPPPPTRRTWSGLRHVTRAGPPSPDPDDPLGEDPTAGLEATFYKVKDGVQIFFSVLFWMSLFFWACAWDERDNSRPGKGSQPRSTLCLLLKIVWIEPKPRRHPLLIKVRRLRPNRKHLPLPEIQHPPTARAGEEVRVVEVRSPRCRVPQRSEVVDLSFGEVRRPGFHAGDRPVRGGGLSDGDMELSVVPDLGFRLEKGF
ncbi:putative methyltransferase PMT11 [Cinnamomum micranthum f. kanehirae]|uniref:Putative methyltransferase PMT11 n=1 Tax=Cinnamomum micranthum f. kanehirae TaxID=337451 RepID=A0A443NX45_9MAGN|nr:putative methyltransferase PMT11 [Cinnamomum micranthum f. kanehirae]